VESYNRPDPATNESIALYRFAVSIDRGELDEAAGRLWLVKAIAFDKTSILYFTQFRSFRFKSVETSLLL
jgi:hypothetical protein